MESLPKCRPALPAHRLSDGNADCGADSAISRSRYVFSCPEPEGPTLPGKDDAALDHSSAAFRRGSNRKPRESLFADRVLYGAGAFLDCLGALLHRLRALLDGAIALLDRVLP